MTEIPDDAVDLSPLREDAVLRASRIHTRVVDRVAAARRLEAGRRELRDGVRQRLARLAIPGALAAAASLAAVLASLRTAPPRPERFAAVILGTTPAARWIALDRRPEIPELVAVVERAP